MEAEKNRNLTLDTPLSPKRKASGDHPLSPKGKKARKEPSVRERQTKDWNAFIAIQRRASTMADAYQDKYGRLEEPDERDLAEAGLEVVTVAPSSKN